METISLAQFINSLGGAVLLAFNSLLLSLVLTPLYTSVAYRYHFWKRQRTTSTTGEALTVFTKLHAKKFERNIPTMAGIVMVLAISFVTIVFNFSRDQTWLPLAAFLGGAAVGLIDDIINIRGRELGVAGLRSSLKFSMITLVALACAWFFYTKLGPTYSTLHIPYIEMPLELGWLIIPLFVLAVVSTGNAVNISDGLDGLAGGLLASAYMFFGVIALLQGNYGIAGFCFTVVGSLISYIWFNIYPARFMMGDVGSFALGTALGVIAMLTDTLFLLPIIGAVFVVEAGSSALQIFSKKVFHKRIFISAPIHHHLEAKGWPETKVTMRFWMIGSVVGFIGLLIALTGGHVH